VSPRPPQHKRSAFTLIELMIAVMILGLVFASSMTLMAMGFQVLDDSRLNTLASQVLQSEMENLRLKNWLELSALPDHESFTPDLNVDGTGFERFSCTRDIEADGANLKKITLTATWSATRGQTRERRYVTFIGKDGLNDFYYRRF